MQKVQKNINGIFRHNDYIHTEKVEKIETYGHKWTSMSSWCIKWPIGFTHQGRHWYLFIYTHMLRSFSTFSYVNMDRDYAHMLGIFKKNLFCPIEPIYMYAIFFLFCSFYCQYAPFTPFAHLSTINTRNYKIDNIKNTFTS